MRPYTLYEVEVRAENSVGRSRRSKSVAVKTYEDVPSAPPPDVELVINDLEVAVVFWKPIESSSANGVVIGYKVRLQGSIFQVTKFYRFYSFCCNKVFQIRLVPEEERYRSEFSRFAEVDALSLKTSFYHLHPFMRYRAFVSAFTVVGSGPENSSAFVTTEEDCKTRLLDLYNFY